MEVRIGVQHVARELVIDSAESQEDVIAAVVCGPGRRHRAARADRRAGPQVVVPSNKLAYVEIGEPESRRVGFGGRLR